MDALGIEFDTKLCNLGGLPLKIDGEEATLKKVSVVALLSVYPEEKLTGDEKAGRYRLAKKIHDGGKMLTPPELETVKTLIGRGYGPMIVGPAYSLLGGE